MKNKKDLLKAKKAKLAILTLCGTLALSGCGASTKEETSEPNYYLITINNTNAAIFEMDDYTTYYTKISGSGSDAQFTVNNADCYLIENIDENSKQYAYDIALSLVGEDGNITFFDADNQLKLSK